jgi:hypothetical protein
MKYIIFYYYYYYYILMVENRWKIGGKRGKRGKRGVHFPPIFHRLNDVK